jgi:hypothetical protein
VAVCTIARSLESSSQPDLLEERREIVARVVKHPYRRAEPVVPTIERIIEERSALTVWRLARHDPARIEIN